MIRQIVETATARCPISVAIAYAQAFLARVESGGHEAIVVAGPLRRRVRLTFGIANDAADIARHGEELHIRWTARTRWLPEFSGALHVRISSVETTLVVLDGSYTPPGGIAGRAFDVLVGRRIAHATARDFVARVARELERRENEWQARFDLAPGGAATIPAAAGPGTRAARPAAPPLAKPRGSIDPSPR